MQTESKPQTAPPGLLPSAGSVIFQMPFENYLTIQADDGLLNERVWLNREQAMNLLNLLPGWIAKLPVSLNFVSEQQP
jgi:hypothetical protein